MAGKLYFVASDATGSRLWQSDGTSAGTTKVSTNLTVDPASGLMTANGLLYFKASDANGSELWRSDGTAVGTFRISDLPSFSANPSNMTNAGGTLYFVASDTATGTELWKTDGTLAGTAFVKDILPGTSSSTPRSLTNVGGKLFFIADDGISGFEIWTSDGTSVGTTLLKDIRVGGSTSDPKYLLETGGKLFFRANDGVRLDELWISDGTTTGTFMVKDINSITGSLPQYLTNVNGTVFFTANDGQGGSQLWKSDGTAVGTSLVKSLSAGNAAPRNFVSLGSVLLFSATNSLGTELWKSDGTANGTVTVKDLAGTSDAAPALLTNVNGTIFFRGASSLVNNGYELFKSDGTAAGTALVKEIAAGATTANPQNLVNVSGTLFFTANTNNYGSELWKSDGSASGTLLVKDIRPGSVSSAINDVINIAGTLYFSATDGAAGIELWKSDGSSAGTVMVKDIFSGSSSSNAKYLTNVNGTLFFVANDGTNGAELWKSDGTAAGTIMVKDVRVGSNAYIKNLINVAGMLYFSATDSTTGAELWTSDGTAAGTHIVFDIFSGLAGSSPRNLVEMAGVVYFIARDATHGDELWRSNGTAAGTVLVKEIRPGIFGSVPVVNMQLLNMGGALYFPANDGTGGYELWKSDGTAVGTVQVKDIWAGIGSSIPTLLTSINGNLTFVANDGVTGGELWQSDGTAAGTQLVANTSGDGGSNPTQIAFNGSKIFYAASSDSYGKELHTVPGPPRLSAPIQIGNGSAQRSRVNQLVADFDVEVTIDPGAFLLQQRTVSGSSVVFTPVNTQFVKTTTANGGTRATITFSGPLVNSAGNLADGNYMLTVLSANIRRSSDNVAFDGDGDGIAGGNFVLGDDEEENFFALFGDTEGDRLVGIAEFGQFRSSFGKSSSALGYNGLFDFDGDNVVGVSDFGQFRSRFGQAKLALFQDKPAKLDYSRDSFSQSLGMSSSPWARVTYDTDATRLTVTVNSAYIVDSQNNIGVYINGVFLKTVSTVFTPATQGTVIVDLPAGFKRVTLQNGPANRNNNQLEGSYIQSVSANRNITRVVAPADNVLVVLGDSIATGASATNMHDDGWAQRLRKIGQQVAFETYGSRSLYDDAATPAARAATVQKLVQYAPARVWIALGTNDYTGGRWTPTEFQAAMRALLQDIRTAMPSVVIYVQSALVVYNETQPVNGYTNQDFRNATQSAADGLSYVTYVNGQPILQLSDLDDGVHPSSDGHLKLFNANRTVLGV